MRRPLPMPVLVAVLFGLLYNISFLTAPAISTGRIAAAVLLVLYVNDLPYAWRATFGRRSAILALLGLVTVYAAIQFVLVSAGDVTQLSRLLNLAFFALLATPLLLPASGWSLDRVAAAIAIASVLQGGLILYSFFSLPYRLWLGTVLIESGNIPFATAIQAPGFSNSAGALLSLVQSLGVFCALLVADRSAAPRRRVAFLLLAGAATVSTVVAGRTGVMLSLLFWATFAVLGGPGRLLRTVAIGAVTVGTFVLVGSRLLDVLGERNPIASATVSWAFEFFTRGTGAESVRDFAGQPRPRVTLETIVGTGRVVGEDGMGNVSRHDSGYVQTYFALGLPMAVLFYVAWAALVLGETMRANTERAFLAVLAVAMFVVEVKEPFIFKHAFPFVLLTLVTHACFVLWMPQSPRDGASLPAGSRA